MKSTNDTRYAAYKDLAIHRLADYVTAEGRFSFRWAEFFDELRLSLPAESVLQQQFEREAKKDGDRLILKAFGLSDVDMSGKWFAGELSLLDLRDRSRKAKQQATMNEQRTRSTVGMSAGEPMDDPRYGTPFSYLRSDDRFETPDGLTWLRLNTESVDKPTAGGNARCLSTGITKNFTRDDMIRRV